MALILKGKTQELVKRHVSTLIPYLQKDEAISGSEQMNLNSTGCDKPEIAHATISDDNGRRPLSTRKAALASRELSKLML